MTRRKVFRLLKDAPHRLFPEELADMQFNKELLPAVWKSVFVLDG